VGACVEEDDAVVWGICDGFLHAGEVEAFGGLRKVRVGGYRESDIGEDLVVVGPGRVAEVDCGVTRVELREEESTEMNCSRPGDGLDGAGAFLSKGGGVRA
jgi:hypothetical protein